MEPLPDNLDTSNHHFQPPTPASVHQNNVYSCPTANIPASLQTYWLFDIVGNSKHAS